MTIDEAIKHCLEVAENNEQFASGKWIGSEGEANRQECEQCASDHRQLAEWLTELKNLREENKVLMQECDRLIKEKGELLNKVSGGDVLRICQLEEQIKDWKEEYANLNKISYGYYKELKEAKRLLKAAVEDINSYVDCYESHCDECCCSQDNQCHWKHEAEALALIGEDGENNA